MAQEKDGQPSDDLIRGIDSEFAGDTRPASA